MTRLSRLLPAAMTAILLSADAGAQQAPPPPPPTYRSVGPDGRIIYSDRIPTDPRLQTHELGKIVSGPLLTPSSGPFDLHPATSLPPAPRLAEGVSPAADISGKPFPPGLPDAILDVVVHQFFAQSLVEICTRAHPAFSERYQGAVRNWRDRSADILARSNRITFARFTGEQRDTLRATARLRLAPLLPAPGASDAEKIDWCDHAGTDMARHQFELVGDMRVAPILFFAMP